MSTSASSKNMEQSMEALTQAMNFNIVPDQEYLLQGSILDGHVDTLKHRLRGLCDSDDRSFTNEIFSEREMVFSIPGTTPTQPLQLRVRRPLESSPAGALAVPWQLRYIG